MIVHDLNVLGARSGPAEAHPKFIVHADAVLAGTATLQRFQPVARRDTAGPDIDTKVLEAAHKKSRGSPPGSSAEFLLCQDTRL